MLDSFGFEHTNAKLNDDELKGLYVVESSVSPLHLDLEYHIQHNFGISDKAQCTFDWYVVNGIV